ncbi:unnamed protein product [Camellia sinensis]
MEEEYSSPTLYKVNVDQNGKRLILPSGYTFSPRDSELVVHYLKKKILNQELPANIITTIDVYSYDSPNQLPFREFKYGLPNEWYFFTTRPPHNLLLTSNGGGWNELADETVVDNDKVIGYKRRLAFYFAKPLQEMETDWFIHEYRVSPAIFTPDELIDNTIKDKISNFVVCKVCHKEKDPSMASSDSSTDSDQGKDREVENIECSIHTKE